MDSHFPQPPARLRSLLEAVHGQYALAWWGLHGVTHWARVYESGVRLAPETNADLDVVLLFTLFHDARRLNEGWDRGHGKRGAEFAASLRGDLLQLSPDRFDMLYYACAMHTEGLTDADPTVQTCWDADRLDLARAGIKPVAARLCTEAARLPETIAWATERSEQRFVPAFVHREWAIPGVQSPDDGWA
ncbi:MAG TPA: hypothetical protein VLL77_05935 [Anaerolineales bacterium]|nr:hypothetical protein [Anaerolineales bacterium]